MFDERLPPHDIQAEQAVLGAILIDPEALAKVQEHLGAGDFYERRHGIVFAAVGSAAKPDLVSVGAALRASGDLAGIGGMAYLSSLAEAVATTTNVEAYAEIVADRSRRRRGIQSLREAVECLYDPRNDLDDAAVMASLAVPEAGAAQYADVEPIATVAARRVRDMLTRLPGTLPGDSWGFPSLDMATGGAEPGALYVIGGRPGMGKTGIGLEMAARCGAKSGKPWLGVSYEMGRESLVDRFIASAAMVDLRDYRRSKLQADEWQRVRGVPGRLDKTPFFVTDRILTVSEIRHRARALQKQHGAIGGVMVDYLQLIKGERRRGQSREEAVGEISRDLKTLAKDCRCAVLALSQLNRGVESRQDKRPMLSDLRESGAIEQDAEAVLLLYRDDYYADLEGRESKAPGVVEVIVGKGRNEGVSTVRLHYKGAWARWDELERRRDGA